MNVLSQIGNRLFPGHPHVYSCLLYTSRVPIPEVGPNDVKIKIHKTAICGTDVHIYQWNDWAQHTIPIGLTAGHEYVGEIVEVGDGVQGFKIGDLVSGEGHITCRCV